MSLTLSPNLYDARGDWKDIPRDTIIRGWKIFLDQPGSATFDFYQTSGADYPSGLFTVAISGDKIAEQTGLSHELSAGDYMRPILNDLADFTRLNIRFYAENAN